jgi:peptide/nickel transport system substrate-binding protein
MSDSECRVEGGRGLTREQLLRRTAAGGLVLAGLPLGPIVEDALAATPRRGGTFRIGIAGGSTKDIIDGQQVQALPDSARLRAGFETLVTYDRHFKISFDGLAEEITPTSAKVWTIRVRDGVEFHNGKSLTADDVIYSLRRLINPKLGLQFGAPLMASLDPRRMKKLDKRTVRLFLKRPDVTILDALAQYATGVVPVGYSPKAAGKADPNVGTGPFKLQRFTPGRESVHVRNPNYWRDGQPYFDQVVIIDFPDDTARVNALLGGQVDAITNVPPAQVALVNRRSNTNVLEAPSAVWAPICMRVDADPFRDVRVRQAMRLIADRPQLVRQAVVHGRVANDLYAPWDEAYFSSLPQRHQDIDRAKALLKAAGQEGLTIELVSTTGALGQNEGAQVFAQQAKPAGLNIKVRILDGATFYGPQYLKWVFSTTWWGPRNYLTQVAAGSLPTSSSNETHWPDAAHAKRFQALYRQALGTVDRKNRIAIEHEMQRMEYDFGGYLIYSFSNTLDAYNRKVKGLSASYRGVHALNDFGHGYRTLWFA